MSTPAKTPEELEQELQQEKEKANQRVDEAAEAAKKEAEKKGATPEEVQAAVEKARTEEKDKLYPQIEALKNAVKEVQETLRAEREEKEQIKREAEEKAERERQAKLSDTELQLEAIKRIEEQLRTEREEREKLESKIREDAAKVDLANYRASVITAAGDEIIPELVAGTTKEEIDRSVITAKARYEELANRFKDERTRRVRGGMPTASPGTEALEEEELENTISKVDSDRYRTDPEYRDKIKGILAHEYAKAAGRV